MMGLCTDSCPGVCARHLATRLLAYTGRLLVCLGVAFPPTGQAPELTFVGDQASGHSAGRQSTEQSTWMVPAIDRLLLNIGRGQVDIRLGLRDYDLDFRVQRAELGV